MDSLAQRAIAAYEAAEAEAQAADEERRAEAAHKAVAKAEMYLVRTLGDLVGDGGHQWTPVETELDNDRIITRTRLDNILIQYTAGEDQYSESWTESLRVVDHCMNEQCGETQAVKFQKVTDLLTLGHALVQNETFAHRVPARSAGYQCNGVEIRYYPHLEQGARPPLILTEPEIKVIEGLREMSAMPEENPWPTPTRN